MLAFAAAIGARPVNLSQKPANINTPVDLAEVENRRDL
jgi:molybdopterin-guanine dinucleotide biosynthesis protein A